MRSRHAITVCYRSWNLARFQNPFEEMGAGPPANVQYATHPHFLSDWCLTMTTVVLLVSARNMHVLQHIVL